MLRIRLRIGVKILEAHRDRPVGFSEDWPKTCLQNAAVAGIQLAEIPTHISTKAIRRMG